MFYGVDCFPVTVLVGMKLKYNFYRVFTHSEYTGNINTIKLDRTSSSFFKNRESLDEKKDYKILY